MSKLRMAKTRISLSEAETETHTHMTAKPLDTPIRLANSQQADLLVPRGQVHRQLEMCHHPLMDQMMAGTLLVRKGSRLCLRNGDEVGLHKIRVRQKYGIIGMELGIIGMELSVMT